MCRSTFPGTCLQMSGKRVRSYACILGTMFLNLSCIFVAMAAFSSDCAAQSSTHAVNDPEWAGVVGRLLPTLNDNSKRYCAKRAFIWSSGDKPHVPLIKRKLNHRDLLDISFATHTLCMYTHLHTSESFARAPPKRIHNMRMLFEHKSCGLSSKPKTRTDACANAHCLAHAFK